MNIEGNDCIVIFDFFHLDLKILAEMLKQVSLQMKDQSIHRYDNYVPCVS